ncbi:hypothetical protein QFZ22_003783 [Streptomyces canus]|uniref:Uncharacterized protein n=1 Tax=Streptomyces canus TaxID=58343 RepID=A0AAW8FD99_9ACTN|nr:hypothetical protein [Streptomyces canus]MDQ0907798.1 hypothetical protein [Streptomyces canus]
MSTVTITALNDHEADDELTVTVSVEYLASLISAKKELKALKAELANGYTITAENVSADELLSDYPELVDYAGMTDSQTLDTYGDLFDYDLYERDC